MHTARIRAERGRRGLRGRLVAAALLLALAAACTFPEGPDWPGNAPPEAFQTQPGEWRGFGAEGQARDLSLLVSESTGAYPAGRDPEALVGRKEPLLVIRFTEPPPDFEAALYDTLRRALELRPSTAFDVVAVAPVAGRLDEAALLGDVNAVVRALAEMGLPKDRVSLSATTVAGVEVHEVHFYVR